MEVKLIIEEDFNDYKLPSMFIATSRCNMKCGEAYCQNNPLLKQPNKEVDNEEIVNEYLNNNLTHAVVLGGLDPCDSLTDLFDFVASFRKKSDDDIVIYTGYTKCEIPHVVKVLAQYPNIIIKFGRYVPGQQSHYDEVLGVDLASDNQYAERIS